MGAVTDDGARLRGRHRRYDLSDDRHLLPDDRRRRLDQTLPVIPLSDESEENDEGHGKDPVDQAGDDGTEADDPEGGRDEIEQDENSDSPFAHPMEPPRSVHRRSVFDRCESRNLWKAPSWNRVIA